MLRSIKWPLEVCCSCHFLLKQHLKINWAGADYRYQHKMRILREKNINIWRRKRQIWAVFNFPALCESIVHLYGELRECKGQARSVIWNQPVWIFPIMLIRFAQNLTSQAMMVGWCQLKWSSPEIQWMWTFEPWCTFQSGQLFPAHKIILICEKTILICEKMSRNAHGNEILNYLITSISRKTAGMSNYSIVHCICAQNYMKTADNFSFDLWSVQSTSNKIQNRFLGLLLLQHHKGRLSMQWWWWWWWRASRW